MTETNLLEQVKQNRAAMNEPHYFYQFKYNTHCICKANRYEYLGVVGTAQTRHDAINTIKLFNKH
jgi:hypothetical protein